MKKTVIRVLFLVWLVALTAAFIYFEVVLISATSTAFTQLADYKVPNASEIHIGVDIAAHIDLVTAGIAQNICLIAFLAVLFASFLAFAIPKMIALFRNHEL